MIVSFPEKDKYVFSSILSVGGLTLFLTLFIVFVSTSALYQIVKQKKISEIKTDFINNMSHEFKTPIATINLALDAISNPKSLKTPNKLIQYANLIREENNRMLIQVENVLRISQLQKSNETIHKKSIDLHKIILEATNHVQLLLKDKGGILNTNLNASNYFINGNKDHITNIIINLMDNAIKYCDKKPNIKIETYNQKNDLVFILSDNGIGMTPNVQKKIFDKFYRATSGNIHNIKGHGLGLSYVKKIIDLHKGKISLESKFGVGTNFIITLPLELK